MNALTLIKIQESAKRKRRLHPWKHLEFLKMMISSVDSHFFVSNCGLQVPRIYIYSKFLLKTLGSPTKPQTSTVTNSVLFTPQNFAFPFKENIILAKRSANWSNDVIFCPVSLRLVGNKLTSWRTLAVVVSKYMLFPATLQRVR